jgi:hypothetical protein
MYFFLPLPASGLRLVVGILSAAGSRKTSNIPGFRLVSGNICLLAGARLIFYFRLSPSSGWWHLLAGCRQAGFCFEYPHLLAGGRRHLLAGYCQAGFDFNFFAFFCPSAAF